MMQHFDQDQHKIPVVYLRKFGYKFQSQWKVSVMKKGERFTRQKSIKSFTAVTNIFDIESKDPILIRIFEQLNCSLETEYNNIINELEHNQTLTDKGYAYLLEIITNFIVRSDFWREFILGFLKHENKENFLHIILAHHTKDFNEFKKLKSQPFYEILIANPPEDIVNRVLLYFMDYLFRRISHYEIVILESQPDKPWFTSTDPVIVHNRAHKNEFFAMESEVYFPLSPKYLIYLHYADSQDKQNPLRGYESNRIHKVTDEQNEKLQKLIIENAANAEYLIINDYFDYRMEK